MSKMKADTWKTILQIAISFLTAIATTLGITSCMGERKDIAFKQIIIKVFNCFKFIVCLHKASPQL